MENYNIDSICEVPQIGFGTYNPTDSDSTKMVSDAIDAGYRYFDTASLYQTERALGRALKESGLKRNEYIVTTKIWIDEMGNASAKEAFYRSLDRTGLDYFDFYLIHWPKQSIQDGNWMERDLETYFIMEELVKEGLIKGLGLSNFLPHHAKNIIDNCNIKPVINQLELHPGYMQFTALSYCKANQILPQAWSPLGRGALLSNEYINSLAMKYNKTAAQIIIRYLLQQGIMPIVKSASKDRMLQNIDVYDFSLSDEEVSTLSCMPQTGWTGEHPDFVIPTAKSNINQ